jgi:isocitrate/isopropylmalate dehydrogenase
MMLDHLGEAGASARVEGAVESVLQGKDVTSVSAASGISTDEWGDRVVEKIRSL